MGYPWYEDYGKYLNKMNTFNDFADCAKYLIKIDGDILQPLFKVR